MAIRLNSELFKNITIQRVAFFIALTISFLFILSFLFFHLVKLRPLTAAYIFLLTLTVFVWSYWVVLIVFERLIFRKIKLIYKLISETKLDDTAKRTDSLELDTPFLDKVENDVVAWLQKKNNEIFQVQQWEQYRREYVGNVSHELKTPIFNLQGYLQTLQNGAIHDPEVNIKFLDKAVKNAMRLQNIVEDLETISKLEGGQMVLEIQSFHIKELINEVINDYERLAKQKQVKLRLKVGADDNYRVNGDKECIRIVLNNLIGNSIKYGRQKGKTKISLYDLETYILVEVSDDGIGISEEDLKHVFDRFYRVDKSRSRDMGGSGLGLSIVKHIVEAHGQKVHVRSTLGVGTTFGFTLEKDRS